jgi:hypothetical protein
MPMYPPHNPHLPNAEPPALLREREAAKFLNVSTAWLERARWAGTGPDYYKAPGKAGAVRYELAALMRWVADHRRTATPSAKQGAK